MNRIMDKHEWLEERARFENYMEVDKKWPPHKFHTDPEGIYLDDEADYMWQGWCTKIEAGV